MTKVNFQVEIERPFFDGESYAFEEETVDVLAEVSSTGTGSYWCSEIVEVKWADTQKLVSETLLTRKVLAYIQEQAVEEYYEEYK